MEEIKITFTLNGRVRSVDADPSMTLLDLLRDKLNMTGTKRSCGIGECGACTVILDGEAVNSCLTLAGQIEGSEVFTIEGLAHDGELDAVQKAFLEEHAVQCGFCTPGMIMSAKALLLKNPHPDREEIRRAMSGNLCRCTGYDAILNAVDHAAHVKNNS